MKDSRIFPLQRLYVMPRLRAMIRRWIGLLLLLLAGCRLNAEVPSVFLWALGEVESGSNDRAVGRAGEVSRYQILPGVWRKYSRSRDYGHASASPVARRHLAWLGRQYKTYCHREATLIDLACMWQVGFAGYRRHQFSPDLIGISQRDRARRIMNLIASQA